MSSDKEANFNQILGSNIRSLREQQGLSLRRFAVMVNLDYSHLSRIERGLADPYLSTVSKIAEGLDVPIYKLFSKF